MTTEEKTKAILEAVQNKIVSSYRLDDTGKGKAITRIKQGKASQELIDKIYDMLLSITKDNQAKRLETLERENKELKEKLAILQNEIDKLKDNQVSITKDNQVSITKDNQASITEYNQVSITKDNKKGICLKDFERLVVDGIEFIIRQEKQVSTITLANGESKQIAYARYYAKKKIAGKLHRVYIGEIPERKEVIQKIKTYCEKHSLRFSL